MLFFGSVSCKIFWKVDSTDFTFAGFLEPIVMVRIFGVWELRRGWEILSVGGVIMIVSLLQMLCLSKEDRGRRGVWN